MRRLKSAKWPRNSGFQSVWEELVPKRSDSIYSVIIRNCERLWKTKGKKKREMGICSIPLAMLVLAIFIAREFPVNQDLLPMLVHLLRLKIGYLPLLLTISLNTATSGYCLYSI